jgi:hypothetical protein
MAALSRESSCSCEACDQPSGQDDLEKLAVTALEARGVKATQDCSEQGMKHVFGYAKSWQDFAGYRGGMLVTIWLDQGRVAAEVEIRTGGHFREYVQVRRVGCCPEDAVTKAIASIPCGSGVEVKP